jgi:hypothetical protein
MAGSVRSVKTYWGNGTIPLLTLNLKHNHVNTAQKHASGPFHVRTTMPSSGWLSVPKSQQPWFDPSTLRHSGIRGAADGAVLKNVHKINPTLKQI